MYEEYLDFVKDYLIKHNGLISERPNQQFRSRYAHTLRVLKWLDLITEGIDVDRDVLYISAVFHDVGYEDSKNKEHGLRGAKVFREFGKEHGFEEQFIERVANIIENHSDKELLGTDISLEQTLLMEADQMDEEGTLRIIWDCFVEGMKGPSCYEEAYYRMIKYQDDMPNKMITPKAKAIWEKKRNLFKEFISQLKSDLFIEEENLYKNINSTKFER